VLHVTSNAPSVPRAEPLHPEFARALQILASIDVSYAEAWRLLRPVAVRLDRPRPSYWRVRRVLEAERKRRERSHAQVEAVVSDLLAGLIPRV
jgi:hypothetical protein